MNYDDDDRNPFADKAIRPATAPPFSNPPTSNEYNPFTSTTIPAQPAPPPQQPNVAAFLPPTQPSGYQPNVYTPIPTPVAVQKPTDQYGSDQKPTSTRVDLTDYERRQAELEEREKRLAEREQALKNSGAVSNRDNNFPPLPKICPCNPCFYQDINIEIPLEFQNAVRYVFYLWLIYSVTLFFNMIAALSYFLTDKEGAATFGLSLVYLFIFIPASYICWFRPIYRAFRTDSSVFFMIFFVVDLMFIIGTVLFAIGFIGGMCGFILMIKLFAAGGSKIGVGLIVMIVTFSFAILALIDGLILIKIHRLYRKSGASLEQAQKEFQTAFVNNPTVRGAAREVATAGINEALRPDQNQPSIY